VLKVGYMRINNIVIYFIEKHSISVLEDLTLVASKFVFVHMYACVGMHVCKRIHILETAVNVSSTDLNDSRLAWNLSIHEQLYL
jgi:hypothetical protein